MLLEVIGVGRAGPVHEVEVNVVELQALQGRVNPLRDTLVPWVVELGGDPDLASGNARVDDTLTNFVLVAVSKSTTIVSLDTFW